MPGTQHDYNCVPVFFYWSIYMKRIVAVGLLVGLTGLTGCSYTKPDQSTWESQIAAQQTQRIACENRKATEAVQEAALVGKMDPVAQAIHMATKNQAHAIAAATGHDFDSCTQGANINDVLIAEVTEKNKTARELGGSIAQGTVLVAGITEAGKTARSGIENAASKTSVQGDNNSTDARVARTETTTSNTSTSATGDSSAGAGGQPAGTAPAAGGTSPVDSAFQSCASRGGTQGNVASCMAMSGVQGVTIEGGITKVGGVPYGPANSYSGYTPVVE